MKPTIKLSKIVHRGLNAVKISFDKNEQITARLKTIKDLKWSQTHQSWYTPYTASLRSEIFNLVRDIAFVDYSALLGEKAPIDTIRAKAGDLKQARSRKPEVNDLGVLSPEKEEKTKQFKDWLASRRYSENTIGTYTDALRTFLRFFNNKQVQDINNNDVVKFNNEYILKNGLSSSFQNQVVNAVKLFFRTIELKSMETELIHRPKRAHTLPNVLSKEEVKSILTAHNNVKHRAMLSLIYSCGLRRSELLNLKLNDIDSKRGLVIIRQAKGKKDRVAPLSEKMLALLRDYFIACKPRVWLFEGQSTNGPYDESSLAAVLKMAVEKSKITKHVTLHWLRHSYATHLLEGGTDLRYIQEILGHSRSTTTEIYTHVSSKNIQKVISPFDTL
ncbi:MAG: tyrosine-type recombinase/integrase [Bacteroidota bacterium]